MTFQQSETMKTVQIPITNDAILENTEVFTAVLQAMDASVVEIVMGTATISIMDDDGTYTYLLQFMYMDTLLYNDNVQCTGNFFSVKILWKQYAFQLHGYFEGLHFMKV